MNFFATLRNLLLNDFGWKIFSIILAAVIWFTVHHDLTEATAAQNATSPRPDTSTINSLRPAN